MDKRGALRVQAKGKMRGKMLLVKSLEKRISILYHE